MYLTLLILILLLVDGYRRTLASSSTNLTFFVVLIGIFGVVLLYLIQVFNSWIRALIGLPSWLSLERAGRQMNAWMIVALVSYILSALGSFGQIFLTLGDSSSQTSLLTVAANLVNYIACIVVVVTIRSWFNSGYVAGPVPQRRALLWSIWGSNALTVVFVIDRVLKLTAHPDISGGSAVATTIVSGLVTVIIAGLVGYLIQLTFGVTNDPEVGTPSLPA